MQSLLKTTIKDEISALKGTIYEAQTMLHIQNIAANLNSNFGMRPYQIEAFGRFIYYMDHNAASPRHILFQMATGSGKTLIMAGIMLELYTRGYHNFIFVVNSTNIIEKTKDNFLNGLSSKYLFDRVITIHQQKVKITEVEHFDQSSTDINILFTTVQGLHAKLNTPRENTVTFQDLEGRKIAILSDEAHHINADTKKRITSHNAEDERESWENTMETIHSLDDQNILVEFTATMDLSHPEIAKKYQDKLLFDYALRSFRNDGYSKEVEVLQSSGTAFERTLSAIILSHYRQIIFEEHEVIAKPVILLKSKTIKESQAFYDLYTDEIAHLNAKHLERIKKNAEGNILGAAFHYFALKGITNEQLATEIKLSFDQEVCMIVNSKNDSQDKQLLLNSLEDETNPYRLIFTVDKLNEGWDVLNLFDIVRLYDSKSSDHKSGKISPTTMSEAQLIGRGARYFPFAIEEDQPLYRRKYDNNPQHPLRLCEQMYYHATYNPAYISELGAALIEIGIKQNPNDKAAIRKPFLTEKRKSNIPNAIDPASIFNPITIKGLNQKMIESNLLTAAFVPLVSATISLSINLSDINASVIRKALRLNSFYHFDALQSFFPQLRSIDEFINSKSYLAAVVLSIESSAPETELLQSIDNQLQLAVQALSVCEQRINKQ